MKVSKLPIARTAFKQATKEERYYYYMVYPDKYELTERELEYLDKLRMAFAVMSNELSNKSSTKKIRKLLNDKVSERQIFNIMNDVRNIFGNIIETNKKFDRMVIRERLLDIAKRAKKEDNLEIERRCYQSIIKMDGLMETGGTIINPEDIQLPNITFTNNPKALLSDVIDYEDV